MVKKLRFFVRSDGLKVYTLKSKSPSGQITLEAHYKFVGAPNLTRSNSEPKNSKK